MEKNKKRPWRPRKDDYCLRCDTWVPYEERFAANKRLCSWCAKITEDSKDD